MNAPRDLPFGVHQGMSNAAYHALPALGSSGLKALAKSPAHYFGLYRDDTRPGREQTASMKLGTLAHCALLEPFELDARYVIKPPGHDGRTTAGKAWCKAFAGLEIVSQEQYDSAKRQAENIRALPEVGALLSRGEAEVSAFWVDEATGVPCKCRPDWVSPAGDGVILLDLKTCQDASERGFPKTIANYGYHLQAAWYSEGYARASGRQVLGFVFACVEAEWPHAAAAYMLDDESMTKGAAECRRLLNLFRDCDAAGRWPGYPNTITPLSLPAWAI